MSFWGKSVVAVFVASDFAALLPSDDSVTAFVALVAVFALPQAANADTPTAMISVAVIHFLTMFFPPLYFHKLVFCNYRYSIQHCHLRFHSF